MPERPAGGNGAAVDDRPLPPMATAEAAPAPSGGGAASGNLTVFVAILCALLRQVTRGGWIARETVDGTRALARLAAELHARAGGFTLIVAADHFRLRESGERVEVAGKAVVQLHRLFQRRGLAEVRLAADVAPLGLRNLARLLLEPGLDPGAVLPPGAGVETVMARADTPVVVVLRDDGSEASLGELPEVAAPAGRPADPLPDGGGRRAAPVAGAAPAVPRTAVALDREAQQLRQENAAIREAVARMVTCRAEAPRPAILTSLEAMERDEHLLYMLVSLRQHDRYTFDHSCNVTLLATAIARQFGVAGEDLRRFAAAVLLHDIGKLYTPLSVLNKPGRFTPDEWKSMRRHPGDGMDILVGAGFENGYSERVTLLHHVAFDGTGYPLVNTLAPDLYAQIVQVADIYDAFTTIRPYRQQARPREVLEVLRKEAGKQFNPAVVEATLRLMGETPIGAVLKLDNGQLGLVVDMGSTADHRPLVRVIQDEFGHRPERTTLLDLSARLPSTGEYMVDIVESVDPVIRNIPIGRYIE